MLDWYQSYGPAGMAVVWNGDYHTYPNQSNFVALCTPVSLLHLFMASASWDDIAYLLLDEVHCPVGLLMLFARYFAHLYQIQDRRARNVKLVLVTATPFGCAIRAIAAALCDAGVPQATVHVPDVESSSAFHRIPLWSVVDRPPTWPGLSTARKGCLAAALMAQWLWEKKKQSAQLLFIVPGEKEVWEMVRALRTYSFNFAFVLGNLYGDSPKEASAE